MKTSKFIFTLLLLSVVLVPALATADIPPQPTANFSDLDSVYNTIGDLLWKVVALVALVMFVIAGIMFMTAAGDPTKVETARKFVLWGVVGVVVAILAYSIVTIIGSVVGP